jgi:Prophage protein (DUF1660)
MTRSLRCRLGVHRWTRYGKPGTSGAHTKCRRCGKRRGSWGRAAAHDFYRSGMDDEAQDSNRVFLGE